MVEGFLPSYQLPPTPLPCEWYRSWLSFWMKKSLVESLCSYSLTSRICWRLPLLRRLPRDWTYTQSGTESGRSSLVLLFQEREYRWGSGEGLLCQQAICKRLLICRVGLDQLPHQWGSAQPKPCSTEFGGCVSWGLCKGKRELWPLGIASALGKGEAIASPPRSP